MRGGGEACGATWKAAAQSVCAKVGVMRDEAKRGNLLGREGKVHV